MNDNNGMITRKQNPYAQVSNSALRDTNLTLKAKGLYAVINAFITIPDFILYKSHLRKQSKGGETNFDNCWTELKDNGYLIQSKNKNDKGQYSYSYELLDIKSIDKEALKMKEEKKLKIKAEKKERTRRNRAIEGKKPDRENPPLEKLPSGKVGVFNKALSNKTDLSNKDKTTTVKKEEPEKVVVANIPLIDSIYKEIKNTIGAAVTKKVIGILVLQKGENEIRRYLDNWASFKGQSINNKAAFFVKAVMEGYGIPVKQESEVKQGNNNQYGKNTEFDQRKYSDEFYNSLYENGGS